MKFCLPPYFSLMKKDFIRNIEMVCFSSRLDGDGKMMIVTKSDEVFGLGRLPDFSLYENVYEPRPIQLLNGKQVKKFVFGNEFVIALTKTGKVIRWGKTSKDANGLCVQLINSSILREQEVRDVVCNNEDIMVLCENNSIYSWGNYSENKTLLKQDDEKIIAITCSSQGLFYLTSKGEVYGLGNVMDDYMSTRSDCCVVDDYSDSGVTSWSKINSLRNIVKIAAGNEHMIALDGDGAVFVWGKNVDKYIQPHPTKLDYIPEKIIDIAAHHESKLSAAMTENSEIYVWGRPVNCMIPESSEILLWGQQVHYDKFVKPVLTSYTSFDEVFANLSHPALSLEPITFNTARKNKNTKDRSLESVFDVQEDSDLTIIVEGKSIFVHRAILKVNSEYFHSMFTNDWKENKKKELEIVGYSYESFRSFLFYLYTGDIHVTSENVFELMKIADQYLDEDLIQLIEKKMESGSISKSLAAVVKHMMKLSQEDYEAFFKSIKTVM